MKNLPHYMLVVCPVNIIVRIPSPKLLKGPHWRKNLKALTAVMRSYDLRQKDIHQIKGMVPIYEDDSQEEAELREKLNNTYQELTVGKTDHFRQFDLYDWDVSTESFKLARKSLP